MEAAFFSLLAAGFTLYFLVRYRRREARREYLRYGMRCRLAGQECGEVDGVLLDIDHDLGEGEDVEDPEYIDRYLCYAYMVEIDGEVRELRGREYVADSVVAEPSFPLIVGRPVRVRYLQSDPEVSALADLEEATDPAIRQGYGKSQ